MLFESAVFMTKEESDRAWAYYTMLDFIYGRDQKSLVEAHVRRAKSNNWSTGIEIQCFNFADWVECYWYARNYADSIGWYDMEIYRSLIFDERKSA